MSLRRPLLCLGLAVALASGACQSDESATGPTDPLAPSFAAGSSRSGANESLADDYLVEFTGSVADLRNAVESAGGSLLRAHPEIGVAAVIDLDAAEASALQRHRGVTRVTRDLIVQWTPTKDERDFQVTDAGAAAIGQPTAQGHFADPTQAFFYPCQWNLTQAACPAAWAGDYGGDPGVKVAVLDSGVDPDHPDLAGRIDLVHSTTFVSTNNPECLAAGADDVNSYLDYFFHGTFVAGIVTSNGLGVAGVAPATQVVGVKVLNCLGSGTFADIIAGILYAAGLGDVDVINMSLGAYFPKNAVGGGPLNAGLAKAVNYAQSRGVLVVSAAGNEDAGPGVGADLDHDGNFVSVPAQSGSGIGVWAGDIDGNLAGYSNFGLTGALVGAGGGDLTASSQIPLAGCVLSPPAQGFVVSVCSTHSIFLACGPTSYLIGSGTSFSTALVSGVAALVDGAAGGSLNPGQLRNILKKAADDLGKVGADGVYSFGRVNAGNAVMD